MMAPVEVLPAGLHIAFAGPEPTDGAERLPEVDFDVLRDGQLPDTAWQHLEAVHQHLSSCARKQQELSSQLTSLMDSQARPWQAGGLPGPATAHHHHALVEGSAHLQCGG